MTQLESGIDLDDSSERQRNDSELVDLISSLPDSILGYILSFRPTKEAVRTSVLSKRWKLAWVMMHNIDFCYVGSWKEHDEDANKKFIRFVIRVLLLNDVGSINKFSLVWHPWCNSSLCRSWTNTAISRNVCHLSLSGQFDLPVSVFNCDSLQSLELKGRIYVPDMVAVCLPRLEALELDGVDFHSEEAFEKLISGCSLLDNLCLNIHSNHGDDFTYIISSASLRRFELCFKHKCSLKLKASTLEYIEVFGCIIETFEHENLRSLLGAYFSIHLLRDEVVLHDNICKSIVEAFDTFYQGKDLNFLADAVRPLTSFHPSRVSNMLRRQSLRPDNIKRYHLCEADPSREMVDQIYDIFQLLPPKIQVCLFTATITEEASLEDITRKFDTIDVLSGGVIKKLILGDKKKKLSELTLDGIDQFYVKVENENQKLQKLSRLFVSVAVSKRIVIFVNTRRKVDWLTNKMRGRGRTIYAIHGDMDRKTRDIIVGKFHSSCEDVLITTNLFAGGFSVLEVSLVVNYDVPSLPEKYLHRGGRFERKKGDMTITFMTRAEEMKIVDIQKFYDIELKYLMAF